MDELTARRQAVRAELPRKLFHVSLGVIFPVAVYRLDRTSLLLAVSGLLLIVAGGELLRLLAVPVNTIVLRLFKPFFRGREVTAPAGVTPFLAGLLISLCLFTRPVCLLALIPLLFGDAAAALAGKAYGRHWLPALPGWLVHGKTWEGAIAFVVVSFVIMSALSVLILAAVFPFWLLALAAVIAAGAELLAPGNTDNIVLPIITGIILSCW